MSRQMNSLTSQRIELLIQVFDRTRINLIEKIFRNRNKLLIRFICQQFEQIRCRRAHLPIFRFRKLLEIVIRVHYSELKSLRLYELVLIQSLRFHYNLLKFLFLFAYFIVDIQSAINYLFRAHWLSHNFTSHYSV